MYSPFNHISFPYNGACKLNTITIKAAIPIEELRAPYTVNIENINPERKMRTPSVFGGFPCVWVTSPRRGFALEKKRLRAFGDRLSVDGARRGIVNAKAAPSSSMVNREKG